LLGLLFVCQSFAVSCLDADGNAIDWWFVFKTPDVSSGRGYAYVYYDSNSKQSTGDFYNDSQSPVRKTVEQLGLYGASVDKSSVGWVMWNDQTYENIHDKVVDHEQDSNGKYYAHSKGMVGFDSSNGFWLAHSTPGFPFDHTICPSNWFFPKSQTMFAQHFLCFTISPSSLDSAGTFLTPYHAYIYDTNLPSGNWGQNWLSFAAGTYTETVDTSFSISSVGGAKFQGYSKNGATDSDLWEDYVAPGLETGILVEGWCCGTFEGDCCNPSHCAGDPITDPSGPEKASGQTHYKYDTIDIESFKFASNDYFATKNNHAKFAVAKTGGDPWFCAGDINRVDTQRKRGGGALCSQQQGLYTWMMGSITAVNTTCSSRK